MSLTSCRFLEVEALVFKIMDDPLHRHAVHIAQQKKSGDKGRCVTGVHKYSRWGLWLTHLAVLCEKVGNLGQQLINSPCKSGYLVVGVLQLV